MSIEARLRALLLHSENKKCADCGAYQPRWASHSLGVFICNNCAGEHRSLGVHISRVRSVDLDTWTEAQVRTMEEMGNVRASLEYGLSYDVINATSEPPSRSERANFIRNKYVSKIYARNYSTPKKGATVSSSSSPAPALSSSTLIDFFEDTVARDARVADASRSAARASFDPFKGNPFLDGPPVHPQLSAVTASLSGHNIMDDFGEFVGATKKAQKPSSSICPSLITVDTVPPPAPPSTVAPDDLLSLSIPHLNCARSLVVPPALVGPSLVSYGSSNEVDLLSDVTPPFPMAYPATNPFATPMLPPVTVAQASLEPVRQLPFGQAMSCVDDWLGGGGGGGGGGGEEKRDNGGLTEMTTSKTTLTACEEVKTLSQFASLVGDLCLSPGGGKRTTGTKQRGLSTTSTTSSSYTPPDERMTSATMTKDDIMALYGQRGQQAPSAGQYGQPQQPLHQSFATDWPAAWS